MDSEISEEESYQKIIDDNNKSEFALVCKRLFNSGNFKELWINCGFPENLNVLCLNFYSKASSQNTKKNIIWFVYYLTKHETNNTYKALLLDFISDSKEKEISNLLYELCSNVELNEEEIKFITKDIISKYPNEIFDSMFDKISQIIPDFMLKSIKVKQGLLNIDEELNQIKKQIEN